MKSLGIASTSAVRPRGKGKVDMGWGGSIPRCEGRRPGTRRTTVLMIEERFSGMIHDCFGPSAVMYKIKSRMFWYQ